ncbi:hypothetical protein [Taibaiella chishuiensis]|uniref:Uncharacterized protein n=1 Tax=Taibaiella chishuiensis TaxID=1434707 RepID=A0A2P8CVQ6_9BACT|nr:hypothetical protein [Taibaiella chishuiensis]PSK89030.1 hypothetical protein B0I18_11342 [Taibaiella chishuiensis]
MDQKLHHTPSFNTLSDNAQEAHLQVLQNLMEEQFASEIEMVRKIALQPRPEAVGNLLDLINRKTLEEQH